MAFSVNPFRSKNVRTIVTGDPYFEGKKDLVQGSCSTEGEPWQRNLNRLRSEKGHRLESHGGTRQNECYCNVPYCLTLDIYVRVQGLGPKRQPQIIEFVLRPR